jgi:hypothetical protein
MELETHDNCEVLPLYGADEDSVTKLFLVETRAHAIFVVRAVVSL